MSVAGSNDRKQTGTEFSRDIVFPAKYNLLGIGISAVTYDQALEVVMKAAGNRVSAGVTHLAVHGLVSGYQDPELGALINRLDIVAPDGHPVRIGLNKIYGVGLTDRCYGPEFTLRVCEAAAGRDVGVYFYGSRPEVVEALALNMTDRFPGLRVAGAEPSIFRPLTDQEDRELIDRINDSGAGVVFIGLGCPLQEKFASRHLGKIRAVQICVGAAFDFHAGNKKMAPSWIQRHSLEWLYRLWQEPGRLWKRYLYTNTVFLMNFFLQYCRLKKYELRNGNR